MTQSKTISNQKRLESLANTFAKRSRQVCKVFDIKIVDKKLKAVQKEQLKMLFVEGKWLYNSLIARMKNDDFDIFKHNVLKDKSIIRIDKDKNEVKQRLEYIPAAIKQSLVKRMCSSIKTLASLKKKGYKVGSLGFISECNSLTFKQFGVTHSIVGNNKVKIAGIKGKVRVRGLDQFLDSDIPYDITSWNLVRKADGYHLMMSVYFDMEMWYTRQRKRCDVLDEDIGIDFGCSSSLTLSDGRKFNPRIEEGERLRRLQRKLQKRLYKRSNNSWKLKRLIRREHQKLNDRKDELANKFVCGLKPYRRVVIQDEQLSEWKSGGHGKAVHHSILGRVKAKIKSLPNARVLDAFIPTTKICLDCGAVQDMKLKDRKFVCQCGVAEDRDVHAAKNMVRLYEMMRDFVGAERTEFKRVDFEEAYESRFHRDYEGCRRMNHEAAASSARR